MSLAPRRLSGFLLAICCLLVVPGGGQPAAQEGGTAPPDSSAARVDSPEGEVLPLTLEETIGRARAASPRLNQLRALQDGAEAQLKGARAERLPQIDFTAGYSRYSDVPELSIPLPPPQGSRILYPNLPNNYSTHLEMTYPLYTGGRVSSLLTAADREREAAGLDVQSGSQDLVLEVSTDYWELVTALENESVLHEALGGYDAHLQDARRREKFGVAARNEVLAVQVERDRAELAQVQAAHDAETIRADLARLLELETGTKVVPTTILEREDGTLEELPPLLDEARGSRPERRAVKARCDAADARARAARADRLPQVQVSAGYDYVNPNRRILPWEEVWRDSWDASVALSFRVFDGGRAAASVEKYAAQAEAARRELEDLDRRIEFEVTRRYLDVQSAALAVNVAERSLESGRENRRVASDRYRAGLIPSSELLDAEVALLKTALERTRALASQRLARAALERALGR
jgi:outer membrane protein